MRSVQRGLGQTRVKMLPVFVCTSFNGRAYGACVPDGTRGDAMLCALRRIGFLHMCDHLDITVLPPRTR